MMCYRDKTWCRFTKCKKFRTCKDALTKKVKQDALNWWGKENPPIAYWSEQPSCFEAPKLKTGGK